MFKMSNKILIFLSYLDFVIAGLLMHISQDVRNIAFLLDTFLFDLVGINENFDCFARFLKISGSFYGAPEKHIITW